MEPYVQPLTDHRDGTLFVWDKKFQIRRQQAYKADDKRLDPEPQQTIVDAFIREQIEQSYSLQYSYNALRRFVAAARLSELTAGGTPSQHTMRLVLLDDRRDPSGGAHSTRNWDEYDADPPKGDHKWSGVLDAGTLYDRLMEKVYQPVSMNHAA